MISLDARHPDAIDFITHKSDLEITQGANMSLRVDKDFFEAVKNDDDWVMEFSRPETNSVITKTTEARDLLNLIAKINWDYAEPGMLFWDKIENWNLLSEDDDFHYAGVNPLAIKRADLKPFLIDLDEDYNSTGRKFKYSVND